MKSLGLILLIIVGAIVIFEVSSLIITLIKRKKDKSKLKQEDNENDRDCNSTSNN